jgi:DNA-directed RNA polymerase subunit M
MKFCPKCRGLLTPSRERLSCKCGYEEAASSSVIKEEIRKSKKIAAEPKQEIQDTQPTAEKECKKCGNKLAYFWTQQTRAVDEPETFFYRCTKCGYTWRKY